MCDKLTEADIQTHIESTGLTRRNFGKASVAAALATALPSHADSHSVTESEVEIDTPDGTADAYFVHPAEGAHPAVMIWPDVMSIRPAFRAMGKRLAEAGYAVLVVNPYYRTHKGMILEEGEHFGMPEVRAKLKPHRTALSVNTIRTDGGAYVDWLDQQDSVDTGKKMGVTGYCMTGSFAFRIAANIPGRIGAVGSFHGGGLTTSSPDSPHLTIPNANAGFLVAIAENDDARQPESKTILRKTFSDANVDAEVEVYEGALHGWCPPDSRVYNEAQAEKAWARMLAMFEKHLV